ncbi:MAG: N-terminal domain, partial [Euryarchaeota archaeon]|nr:N-terminal domain [Euryarchaeota archaeon]
MIFDGWLGLQMRAFYKSYPNEAIVQQPAAQIPWFHKSKALPEELRGNLPSIEEVETELEGMGGTGGNLRMACEELFDV